MAIKIVPNDPVMDAILEVRNIAQDLFEQLGGNDAISYSYYVELLPFALEIWKETRHGF
jgi:hypothetical protein